MKSFGYQGKHSLIKNFIIRNEIVNDIYDNTLSDNSSIKDQRLTNKSLNKESEFYENNETQQSILDELLLSSDQSAHEDQNNKSVID